MKKGKLAVVFLLFPGIVGVLLFYVYGRSIWVPLYRSMSGKETLATIREKYGATAQERLEPYFKQAGVAFPPQEVKLLALKQERLLELWAKDGGTSYRWIRNYPIQAASGGAGPKLREGDKQVPEGQYKIVGLNPNSSYYLSMKLNYPNDFDLLHARLEGRNHPGSDIFIHGKAVSIGCLAMGDTAIEELFLLVSRVGTKNSEVLIAPRDPRAVPLTVEQPGTPAWLPELYRTLNQEFNLYRKKA
ncbi:MAG: L,D-transpeptidase family protein [Gammaproteobacteria bacterium]